jgi:hypothetical protein
VVRYLVSHLVSCIWQLLLPPPPLPLPLLLLLLLPPLLLPLLLLRTQRSEVTLAGSFSPRWRGPWLVSRAFIVANAVGVGV